MHPIVVLVIGIIAGYLIATIAHALDKKKKPEVSPLANTDFAEASTWIPPSGGLWQPPLIWKVTYIILLGDQVTQFDTIEGEPDVWHALKVFVQNHQKQYYFIMSVEELTPINNG
jgi:hypothetical protein